LSYACIKERWKLRASFRIRKPFSR